MLKAIRQLHYWHHSIFLVILVIKNLERDYEKIRVLFMKTFIQLKVNKKEIVLLFPYENLMF